MEFCYSVRITIEKIDENGNRIGNIDFEDFNFTTNKSLSVRNYLQKLAETEPDDVEILEFY